MQKLIVLLCLLLILPISAFAAPDVTSKVLNYNFGEVAQGDKVGYTFRFKNSGDEMLEISSVSSSCGCTAALLSSKRVAPGDMGEIKATFDSGRFRGHVSKTITMTSNAATHPQVFFKLEGTVKELLGISMNHISWVWHAVDQTEVTQIIISNQSEKKITLQTPAVTNPQLTATLEKHELPPGEKTFLRVSGKLGAGEERLNGYIVIGTDFGPMPQLRVSVSGRLIK
ncbi:DUF1573 domain-containing protein [Geopsychrobacter electrodiphilus]|uniref:DUF1573 domain-containing protein n=1 Tax=Geopsychrobacter electrodiphilus TaxID=225196 RepID=UPI00037D188B|nr:DUF1573 domain-containing protein [Geopsychrobacter electrodiphilus]